MSVDGIGKPSKAMAISHKDRAMKVAWDMQTYIAINRLRIQYKRGAIGLSMLQMRLRKECTKAQDGRLTILAEILP
jgi:hypothetical protein